MDRIPNRVLTYKDKKGRTITDPKFDPFIDSDIMDVVDNKYIVVLYGDRSGESNIQEVIDANIDSIHIDYNYVSPEEIMKVLREGYIRRLHSNCPIFIPYHVDFVYGPVNISSYYGSIFTDRTVVLHVLIGHLYHVNHDLIRLTGYELDDEMTDWVNVMYDENNIGPFQPYEPKITITRPPIEYTPSMFLESCNLSDLKSTEFK